MTPTPSRWLLFIYRVPAEPSSHRTYVWRQLKQLGAVYLQQASAILPDDPTLRDALNALGARVQEAGGEVSLLDTASPTAEWETQLLARFRDARDAEYAEVAENERIARDTTFMMRLGGGKPLATKLVELRSAGAELYELGEGCQK